MIWEHAVQELKSRPITWVAGKERRYYHAVVEHVEWTLRLNDFPDEPLCTLFQGDANPGVIVEDIPLHWHWLDDSS